MTQEIYISGTGIISAIGNDTQQCLTALKTGKSGIGEVQFLQTRHKGKLKVGEVKQSTDQLLVSLGCSRSDYVHYTRTSLLGMMAAKEALNNAELDLNDGFRTGLISATTVGGMDKTELCLNKPNTGYDFIATHPCGDSTEKIADYLNLRDYRTTISTACSSGANAMIHGVRMIQGGRVDRALVGGVDALSKFTLNGFNSLGILDRECCKPFDQNRQGLNLGEAAGFIVIESDKSLKSRGKVALCRVVGLANANDAYHQTASSPEGDGAYLAMEKALQMSGLKPENIDYINAHGTGTANNDLSEGIALKRIFGESLPPFSSTKSFTGHTLGAAAGVEAVFSVLSLQHDLTYPNLNYSTAMEELDISPETRPGSGVEIHNVLSNSFGFGGNSSTLIFSK